MYRLMRKATSVIHTSETKSLLNLPIILVLIYVNQSEDIDHANVIFRTGPRVTYVVLAGDLVPAGTMLVTPALSIDSHYI